MKSKVTEHKLSFFYLFAFLISWISWFVMWRIVQGDSEVRTLTLIFSTLGGLGPMLSLFILEKATNKEVRVREVLSHIRLRGARYRWFFLATLTYPAVTLISLFLNWLVGIDDHLKAIQSGPDELGIAVIPVMLIHFAASLVTSPLFEEPGWRGFALGRLQRRFGSLIGSLIVGGLWWLWHQPMNLALGANPTWYSFSVMILFSFFIDSVFTLSGRNLLVAMLAHQSAGTVFAFLNRGEANVFELGMMILIVIGLRLWERGSFHQVDGSGTDRCEGWDPANV